MKRGKFEYKHENAFKYSDESLWSNIEKQSVFEAWVPFISNRPMPFFVSDKFEDGEPVIHNGSTGYLTDIIGDDSKTSMHYSLNVLKRRKVVILSSDEVCKGKHLSDVLVARIVSVKDYQRDETWYPSLVDGTHPWLVHLPENITGMEAYVNMTQPIPIGKSLLIEKHEYMLDSEKMTMIEKRFAKGLELGVIKDIGDQDSVAINE